MKPLSVQLRVLLTLGALLILIEIINVFTANALNQFGVIPRSLSHLPYIFSAPFLHGSPSHLMANLIPLLLFTDSGRRPGKNGVFALIPPLLFTLL